MENLSVYDYYRLGYSLDNPEEKILSFTTNNDILYTINAYGGGLSKIKMISQQGTLVKPISLDGEIISSNLQYLPHVDKLFLSTNRSFFIISSKLEPIDKESLVESPDNDELLAASWNTECEYLAAFFKTGTVKVCSMDWANKKLITLSVANEEKKAGSDVYLGWGKKTCQFKGQFAKQVPDSKYKCNLSDANISWKYQENTFAINMLSNGERFIKIYDSDCLLLNEFGASKLPGLLEKVAYRSKRNMLASICQNDDNEQYVVLYERNGGFIDKISAQAANINILHIAWSTCGNILSVWNCCPEKNINWVDLYTETCLSWHVKQRIQIKSDNPLLFLSFQPTHDDLYRVGLILKNGYVRYDFISRITPLTSESALLVIEGSEIHIHDYKTCVVPPQGKFLQPVQSFTYFINAVLVHSQGHLAVTIDSNEIMRLYRLGIHSWLEIGSFSVTSDLNLPISFYKSSFGNVENKLIFDAFLIQDNNKTTRLTRIIDINGENGCSITPIDNCDLLITQIEIINNDYEQSKPMKTSFFVPIGNESKHVVLNTAGDLLIDDHLCAQNVTSIYNLADKFLFATQNNSNEPFDLFICILYDSWKNNCYDLKSPCWVRRIEKAAIIVSVSDEHCKVVLYMPRGNTEIILVRPVQLEDLYQLLANGKYEEALYTMKLNALKLDLLHDLLPESFQQNLQKIFRALGTEESVIKFLLELDDTSALDNLDYMIIPRANIPGKRNQICEALLKFLLNQREIYNFLKLIVMCVWVMDRSNLKEPLKYISLAMMNGFPQSAIAHINQCIDALSMYVPERELYKAALSIYDFQLAEMIANRTQMDPQFYKKFLSTTKKLGTLEKRFTINNHIENYPVATKYLVLMYRKKVTTIEQLVKYLLAKKTVSHAYEALTVLDEEAFIIVSELMAESRIVEKDFQEASSIFLKAGLISKAVNALIRGQEYLQAVSIISCHSDYKSSYKKEEYLKIAAICKNERLLVNAAKIYFDFIHDNELGFECLLEGFHFTELLERLHCVNEEIYVPKVISRLKDYYNLLVEKHTELKNRFEKHFERLKVVRQLKQDQISRFEAGDANAFNDTYSETSTRISMRTSVTNKTAKLERKIRNLKIGSAYEDVALIRELFETVLLIFSLAEDVQEYCKLADNFQLEDNENVLKNVTQLQNLVIDYSDDIWLPIYGETDQILSDRYELNNIMLLEAKYRRKPDILSKKFVSFT